MQINLTYLGVTVFAYGNNRATQNAGYLRVRWTLRAQAEEKEVVVLVITSSGFHNPQVLDILKKYSSSPSRIGIITAAIDDKEKQSLAFLEYRDKVQDIKSCEVVHLEVENLSESSLSSCSGVIILGGNSRLLFDVVRKINVSEILVRMARSETNVVITVSAASMLFAGENRHCLWIDPILQIDQGFYPGFNHEGLGFLPDLIIPHIEKFYEICPAFERELQEIERIYEVTIKRMKRSEFMVI